MSRVQVVVREIYCKIEIARKKSNALIRDRLTMLDKLEIEGYEVTDKEETERNLMETYWNMFKEAQDFSFLSDLMRLEVYQGGLTKSIELYLKKEKIQRTRTQRSERFIDCRAFQCSSSEKKGYPG